jgi:hypothetical protein
MHDRSHAEIHHLCVQANLAQKFVLFRHVFIPKHQQGLLLGDTVHGQAACEKALSLKAELGIKADDIFVVVIDGDLYDDEDNEYFCVSSLDYASLSTEHPGVGIVSVYFLDPNSAYANEEGGWKELTEAKRRAMLSSSILLVTLCQVTTLLTGLETHEDFRGCVMDYCQRPTEGMGGLRRGFRFCAQCVSALQGHDEGMAVLEIAKQMCPFRPPCPFYEVALSYASEDGEYVSQVASILNEKGVKVFYDKYEQVHLWGKNLLDHLGEVYRDRADYTVMFISKYYKGKLWTNHERQSAQARAFLENQASILPARFDDTDIPGVSPTVGYISLQGRTPQELAEMILQKVRSE